MCTSMTLFSVELRAVSFQTSPASVSRDTSSPSGSSDSAAAETRAPSARRRARRASPSAHHIHLQIAHLQTKRLGRAAAPEQRPDPREQLGEGERLDEIVVRPAVEADAPDRAAYRARSGSAPASSARARAASRRICRPSRPGNPRSSRITSNVSVEPERTRPRRCSRRRPCTLHSRDPLKGARNLLFIFDDQDAHQATTTNRRVRSLKLGPGSP